MWQDTYDHQDMMGWDGLWDGMMGFHGVFSLLALAVIVFAAVALYHDWRRDRLDDQDWQEIKHE